MDGRCLLHPFLRSVSSFAPVCLRYCIWPYVCCFRVQPSERAERERLSTRADLGSACPRLSANARACLHELRP
eukprot:4192021-Alexandrium_andersonii.AAC.2